jgi:hypothetical protein
MDYVLTLMWIQLAFGQAGIRFPDNDTAGGIGLGSPPRIDRGGLTSTHQIHYALMYENHIDTR